METAIETTGSVRWRAKPRERTTASTRVELASVLEVRDFENRVSNPKQRFVSKPTFHLDVPVLTDRPTKQLDRALIVGRDSDWKPFSTLPWEGALLVLLESEVGRAALEAIMYTKPEALRAVERALPTDSDPTLRADLKSIIDKVGDLRSIASPTTDELDRQHRRLKLDRPSSGPRGSIAASAKRREHDLRPVISALLSPDDERRAGAAATFLGEAGGNEELGMLGYAMRFLGPLRVRRAAAAATANIGGPDATHALLRMLEASKMPKEVRVAGLTGLFDLVTRDWDAYQMGSRRVVMPPWLRARLQRLADTDPTISETVTSSLRAFD